jgi:uncharacterized membrane protein
MKAHNVEGLWRLTLLTSTLSLLPLSLIWLLPSSPEEQQTLVKSQTRSKLGGAVFLAVLFSSLTWTIVQAAITLVKAVEATSSVVPPAAAGAVHANLVIY